MHVSLYPSVSASERECVCVCVYEVCVCWFGVGEFQLCQSELVQMSQLPKERERGNRRLFGAGLQPSTMVGQRGVTMSWYWWGTLAKLLSSGVVLMLDGPPG